MPRIPVVEHSGRAFTFIWSSYLTLILFIVGIAGWILGNWEGFVLGYHVHHFPLGLWMIFLSFFSFILTGVSLQFTFKNPATRRTYRFAIRYVTIPMVSALIYLLIGLVLIITDWSDFARFISNPWNFNWGA